MPTIPLYFWQKKAILDTLPYIKIVFSCVLYYTIITTKQNQFSNKHGYAISSGYRCKYIVYKLSSSPSSSYSSHNLFRILLHILHQSLYFVLRLGYALLLFLLFLSLPLLLLPSSLSLPLLLLILHQISHVRMGYVRVIHQIMHVIVKKFFGIDRKTDRLTN